MVRALAKAARLAPDIIHDLSPASQMLRLPVSVVILDLLIHPAQHRTNLCWVMTAISRDRVDGVPEAMGSQPPVTRLDLSTPESSFKVTAPPCLANP